MALGVFTAVRSILRTLDLGLATFSVRSILHTLDMVEDKELEKAFEQLYFD